MPLHPLQAGAAPTFRSSLSSTAQHEAPRQGIQPQSLGRLHFGVATTLGEPSGLLCGVGDGLLPTCDALQAPGLLHGMLLSQSDGRICEVVLVDVTCAFAAQAMPSGGNPWR